VLEVLMQYGVNHIDVASSYGDAELRIAPWLARHRSQFFVATKTDARTEREATEDLHRSLERMGIDSVDLWQLHNLADPIEWDTALSPGGAVDAAVAARKQGLVRFIGVTGHGLQIAATHRRSLDRFDFDAVLLPYNFLTMQSPYYAEQFNALLATCQKRNVAVQTIKSIASKPWMGRQHTRDTWYEPLEEQQDIDLAVALALGGDCLADVARVGVGFHWSGVGLSGRVGVSLAGSGNGLQSVDHVREQLAPGSVRGQVQAALTAVLSEAAGDAEQP